MTTTAINPELAELEELAQENQRLTAAQQAIVEIQAKRATRQRAADIALLAEVRNELAERQTFSEKYNPIWRQQAQDADNARSHVLAARVDVAESQRRMPSVAQYLPDDSQVVRWREHHEALLDRLTTAQEAFATLPDPEVLRMELAGVIKRIIVLSYTAQNITAKLEGFSGKSWLEGGPGVSNVGNTALLGTGKAWIL